MKPAPGTDYASINRRLSEIEVDLADAFAAWEKASAELEKLDAELED